MKEYRRSILCTKVACHDGRGLPDDWERDFDNSRRPAWIEKRGRFIQRRLTRPDCPVHVWLRKSDVSFLVIAEVLLHRAGISRRKLLRLFPHLRTWDWTLVDDWGEALLKTHVQDFERGIAESLAWDLAVKSSPRHRHYGLLFLSDPSRLVFAVYPQRVADAFKESLAAAATEAEP